ncbi:hypothetical protein F0342_06935 [Bacillus sp. CH30_1T]|uniref:hypothetical protein n=1 Tax=Bacillus sp. CH30_1T TaxID=2604836 RepID=UPI0011ECB987|nr:hypothetical protein [Bacillus sp. CH30_1T]KAA0565337.1 hypothetical protein F0342_06935 [Bacillus sp. CH30_1T]
MAYKVVTSFFDKEDNKRLYEVGQSYPRTGFEPSEERIKLLSTVDNDEKTIFIKEVKKKKSEPKKSGK